MLLIYYSAIYYNKFLAFWYFAICYCCQNCGLLLSLYIEAVFVALSGIQLVLLFLDSLDTLVSCADCYCSGHSVLLGGNSGVLLSDIHFRESVTLDKGAALRNFRYA